MLQVNATRYTPLDSQLIAVGTLEPVAGTPLDFTTPTRIGLRFDQLDNGYDINYNVAESQVPHPTNSALHLCAT